jgi:hypothetical protein
MHSVRSDKVKFLTGYPAATCRHQYCHALVNSIVTHWLTPGGMDATRTPLRHLGHGHHELGPHRVVEAQGEDETTVLETRHLPENQLGIISKNGHEKIFFF